jgi:mannose-6-phosphate isomerase-like protein (cupin superfamily)
MTAMVFGRPGRFTMRRSARTKGSYVRHIRQQDVTGVRAPAPHARTLKHLAAPWTIGSEKLWVGLSEVDPGSSSNRHSHAENEEVFYVVSGRGFVEVDDERQAVGPGSVVLVPAGSEHCLVNPGDEMLQVICSVSPAFELSAFDASHLLDGR